MSTVLYERTPPIARVIINRPEAMNAFDLATARELAARLLEFDKDDALRVATSPHDFKLLVAADGRRSTSMDDILDSDESGSSANPTTIKRPTLDGTPGVPAGERSSAPPPGMAA